MPTGERLFVLQRSLKDVYRGEGNVYIAHGVEDGQASWSVETLLLSKLKAREIQFLVIHVRETKARFITPLERFINESRMVERRRRNGSMQRSLPLSRFVIKQGVVKL